MRRVRSPLRAWRRPPRVRAGAGCRGDPGRTRSAGPGAAPDLRSTRCSTRRSIASRTSAPKPPPLSDGVLREKLRSSQVAPGAVDLRLDREVGPGGERQPLPTARVLVGRGSRRSRPAWRRRSAPGRRTEVVGAPVHAFDDGVGRALAARHAARARRADRAPARLARSPWRAKPSTSGSWPASVIARCIVLMMSPRMPRSRSVGSRPASAPIVPDPTRSARPSRSSLPRSPDHQPPQFGVFSGAAGAEVDHAAALIGDVAQRAIEAGPALRLDLLLQGGRGSPARCAGRAPG